MATPEQPPFASFSLTDNEVSAELSLSHDFHGKSKKPRTETSFVSSSRKPFLGAKASTEHVLFPRPWATKQTSGTEGVREKIRKVKQSKTVIFPEYNGSSSAGDVSTELALFDESWTRHYSGDKVSTELVLFDQSCGTSNTPRTEEVQKKVETGKRSRTAIFPECRSSSSAGDVPTGLVFFHECITRPFVGDKVSNELVLSDQSCETNKNTSRTKEVQENVETGKQNRETIFLEHNKPSTSASDVSTEIILFGKSFTIQKRETSVQSVSTSSSIIVDPWKLKKKLTSSDVGNQCRLLLETSFVKANVFPYMAEEKMVMVESKTGEEVKVWDEDTKTEHKLVLKLWRSSMAYVLVDKWQKDFVKRRSLKKGDEIGLYWHSSKSRFCFSVLKRV